MPIKKVIYSGISGGRSPSRFRVAKDQFESSCGIDPDLSISQTDRIASGIAVPSIYSKFSGTPVDAPAVAFITCPKNTNIYSVLNNGKLISYSKTLGTETLIGTMAGSNAGGACYYNNYIYIFGTGNQLAYDTQTVNYTVGQTLTGGTSGATAVIKADADGGDTGTLTLGNITGVFQVGETITDGAGGSAKVHSVVSGKTDVSRYGPLDGSPTITGAWWGGLGLTLLTDTTYPTLRLAKLPNHWAFVHGDNSLYFLDFAVGQGLVHRIHTKKVTYEGDTNDTTVPSAYNVFDLPAGFYPISLASYGTSLAISAIQTNSYEMNQGNANLFIWNTTNVVSFDQQIPLPDPLASALLVRNGYLHVFSGSAQGGIRVSTYSGGDTLSELAYIDDGIPPFPGAVDTYGNRLYFGTFTLSPVETSCVYAIGSRTSGKNDVQNIITVGSQLSAQTQMVYAIKVVSQQTSWEQNPQIIVGAADTTAGYALYKKNSAGTLQSILNLPSIIVGAGFRILKMRVPLASTVESGTVISPIITYDESVQTLLTPISNSNYPGKNKVIYRAQEMTNRGENQFKLQFQWAAATVPTAILFPIEIILDVDEDEKT